MQLITRFFTIAFFLIVTPCLLGQTLIFEENFDYPDGSNLNGQGGWGSFDGILVSDAANLVVPRYPSVSGGGIVLDGNFSPALTNNFPGQLSGDGSTVFLSFIVLTPDRFTQPDHTIIELIPDSGYTPENRIGFAFTKIPTRDFGAMLFTGNHRSYDHRISYAPRTIHTIIMKYTFVPGPNNDVVDVHITRGTPIALGTPAITKTTTEGDPLTDVGGIRLVDDGVMIIDGIRIFDSFSLMPVTLQNFTIE